MDAIGPHLCFECKKGRHQQCISNLTAEFKSSFRCVCGVCHPDPLLDAEVGQAGAEEGMERAQRGAPQWYRLQLWEAIIEVATTIDQYSTDQVWEFLGPAFPRTWGKALGPLMKKAEKAGIHFVCGSQRTEQVTRHRSPQYIWESKILGHDPEEYPYS